MKKIFYIVIIITICIMTFIIILKNENIKGEKEIEIVSHYNNPIIPEGFKPINTKSAKWRKDNNGIVRDWNKGLVIEDDIGNQFVWVPINLADLNYYKKDIPKHERFNRKELNIENDDDRQVLKYGGFYISRYEAGVMKELQDTISGISSKTNNVLGIPVSKKGIRPWNYISFKKAKLNAESMYTKETVKSKLLTQKQYQGVMQWLNSCGYSVYGNSSSFGNYSNAIFKFSGYYSEDYGKNYKYGKNIQKGSKNVLLSSGATDRNMINNIYDLAGNLMEYVEEHEPRSQRLFMQWRIL